MKPARLLMVAVVLGACAQASAPPGGARDQQPPRVLTTEPAEGAVVPNFKGPVRFHFDETLSERGPRPAELVLVSPEGGEVEVKRSGHDIRVDLKNGWQNGKVYHVTVLPGVVDRFGNSRPSAYELVFSTGPAITSTAVAGIVTDRLTGRAVANARVMAVSFTDSTAYTTLTDTAGFFALRSLPATGFRVTAFVDQNRDHKLSGLEARDTRAATLLSVRDTQVVEFSVLAYDTTVARLLRADARDSIQVRLFFDDFMEATEPLASVLTQAWRLPDSVAVTGSLFHSRDYEKRQRALRDTTGAPPAPVIPRGAAPDTARALPSQELVWVPSKPLEPRTRYRITVMGVRNISGLTGGGGSVTFETPQRVRVAPRDTTTKPVKPDTSKTAKPDTIKHL